MYNTGDCLGSRQKVFVSITPLTWAKIPHKHTFNMGLSCVNVDINYRNGVLVQMTFKETQVIIGPGPVHDNFDPSPAPQ